MTSDFSRKALALHNQYRAQHNAPPLEWSLELERGARDHATSLLSRQEGEPLAPKKGLNLGQNVFELRKKGSGLQPVDDLVAVERAIDTWYDDLKDYDPNSPSGSTKGRSFSQLVWSSTRRVGLGLARKETAGSMNIVVIGFYDPPGNYKGEFESNVTVQKTNTCLKSTKNDSRNSNQWDSNRQNTSSSTNNQNFTSTRQIQVNTSDNLVNQQHQRRDDDSNRNRRDVSDRNGRDSSLDQNSSTTTKSEKRVTTTMQKNLVMDTQNLDDDHGQHQRRDFDNQQVIKKQNRDDHSTSTSSNVENSTFESTKRVTSMTQQTAFKNVSIEERDLSSEIRDLRFDDTQNRQNQIVDNQRRPIVSNVDDQVSTKLTQQQHHQQHHHQQNQKKVTKTSNRDDSVINIRREDSPPTPKPAASGGYPRSTPVANPTGSGVQQQSTTTTTSTKKTMVVMTTGEFGEQPVPPPMIQSQSHHHHQETMKKIVNLENTSQNYSDPPSSPPAKPERIRVENNTEKSRVKEVTNTSTSTTTTTESVRVAVELHNEIRRKHGASNVTIDHKLCEEAQTYAKSIITKTERKESLKVGRNVYQMTGSGSPIDPAEAVKRAMDSWYSKIDEYNWDDPMASGSKAKLFTQLIWKSCNTIGVAVETCTKTRTTAVVVLYSPPGNITSDQRYKENVQKAIY